MNKIHSYLGLSMRAGKLVTGDEGVLKAIRSGEARLVMVAEDAAANAVKKFSDKCKFFKIPLIQYGTRSEIGNSIGKQNRVVVAVIDQGFARMIQQAFEKQTEVHNIDET